MAPGRLLMLTEEVFGCSDVQIRPSFPGATYRKILQRNNRLMVVLLLVVPSNSSRGLLRSEGTRQCRQPASIEKKSGRGAGTTNQIQMSPPLTTAENVRIYQAYKIHTSTRRKWPKTK